MKIVINKSQKKLFLLENNIQVLSLPISIGAETGHKQIEGDNKTPEGEYEVLVKNPKSEFHLSLGLSYPNKSDAHNGFNQGIISQEECNEICERLDSGRHSLEYKTRRTNLYSWKLRKLDRVSGLYLS